MKFVAPMSRLVAVLTPLLFVMASMTAKAASLSAGAVCQATIVYVGDSAPLTCSSGGAQASIAANFSAVGNTVTFSLHETGSLNSLNGAASYFQTWANIPIGWSILGPDRDVVEVSTFSVDSYQVNASSGTLGEIEYAAGNRVQITTRLTGGATSINDVLGTSGTTTIQGSSSQLSNSGVLVELGLIGSITSGTANGFIDTSYTRQFFEADGVTPASVSGVSISLISAPVPEPSSLLLVLPGIFAVSLGAILRKRFSTE